MTFPVAGLKQKEDFVILLNSRIAHPGDVRLMIDEADGSSGSNLLLTAGRQQHLYKRRAKRGASREREGEEKERGVAAHEGDDGGQDAEGG